MLLTIVISQKDIESGIRMHRCECPIALAIKRHLDWRTNVAVATSRVTFEISPYRGDKINLPEEAKEFIRHFDDGKNVNPFYFLLDIPEFYLKENRT